MRSLRSYFAGAFAALLFALAPALAAAQTISQPAGLFGPSSANCNTLTVSQPCFAVTGTWNNGAVTFPGALTVNMTDTASAAGTLLMDAQIAGASQFSVRKDGLTTMLGGLIVGSPASTTGASLSFYNNGLRLGSSGLVSWTSGAVNGTGDLILARDAANTLALRNLANAQTLRVYNTTDGTNGDFGTFDFTSTANVLSIGSKIAGTGTLRQVNLLGGSVHFIIGGSTDVWAFNSSGHFVAGTDNTYDIGATASGRPRNIYAAGGVFPINLQVASSGYVGWSNGTNLASSGSGAITLNNNGNTLNSTITVGASNLLTFQGGSTWGGPMLFSTDNTWDIGNGVGTFRPRNINAGGNLSAGLGQYIEVNLGRSKMFSDADGNVRFTNSSASTFGLLQFGGTTNLFPAWKRNGAEVDARLADDSGFADVAAGSFYPAASSIVRWAGRSQILTTGDTSLSFSNNADTTRNTMTLTASGFSWDKHQGNNGTAPAVTSCGTSPSIVGSDTAGEVTTGTGTPTACTITFNVAYSAQPYCIVANRTALANLTSYTVSNSAIVLTTPAASSQKIPYHCIGA